MSSPKGDTPDESQDAGCDDLYLFSDGDPDDERCAVCGDDVFAHHYQTARPVEDVDTRGRT